MADLIFTEIDGAADISPGEVQGYDLPCGRRVAVYNVDGEFYATDDLCTHGNASLSDGDLEGAVIFCPYHGGSFDVRTGRPCSYPTTVAVRAYQVVERGGVIGLQVPSD